MNNYTIKNQTDENLNIMLPSYMTKDGNRIRRSSMFLIDLWQ